MLQLIDIPKSVTQFDSRFGGHLSTDASWSSSVVYIEPTDPIFIINL